MDKIAVPIVIICGLGLFSTLIPLYAEWSGSAEIAVQANIDAESCPGTNYQKIDDVIYCEYQGRLVKPREYVRININDSTAVIPRR